MDDAAKNLDQEHFNYFLESQKKMRQVFYFSTFILVIILGLYFSAPELLRDYKTIVLALIAAITVILSVFILQLYLQIGFKKRVYSDLYNKNENELGELSKNVVHSTIIDPKELVSIKNELAQLREQFSHTNSIQEAITSDQRDELVALLKTELVYKSIDLASQEVLEKIENKISKSNQFNEIEGVLSRTLERLYKEIDALSRRGNLNLSLGILTTIIGLGIFGFFVLEIDSVPEDKMAFIAYFIPRLSLVILIEVFAYFFLKLYKSSLSEIKYFQNEMTNVEAKLAAVKCSILMPDTATISDVIRELSSTERNSVLEKGQTTAEIEKAKIEQRNILTISEKVSNILGMKK